MIRVNLLPRRREQKREGGNLWIVALAVVVLAEIVGIIFLHAQKKKELDDVQQANNVLTASINQKKAQVQNHEAVKKELAEYQKREDAISQLQSGRTGPTALLLELSRMLTPRKLPTTDPDAMEKLRRENPLAIPSERWDPKRLWLTSFKEDNKNVVLFGLGKTNDDVAEFLRRLSVSRYFDKVKLVKTEEKTTEAKPNVPSVKVISFEMRASVRY
jgi:type IV pilus assembly protein PilN